MKKLDIVRLIERYPKVKEFIISEVRNNIKEMQQRMIADLAPEERNSIEIPEITNEEVIEFLSTTAENNLQLLVYLLDSVDIYIVPVYLFNGDWTGSIYSKNQNEYEGNNILSSRTEVIIHLFPSAVEILENKLKKEENE